MAGAWVGLVFARLAPPATSAVSDRLSAPSARQSAETRSGCHTGSVMAVSSLRPTLGNCPTYACHVRTCSTASAVAVPLGRSPLWLPCIYYTDVIVGLFRAQPGLKRLHEGLPSYIALRGSWARPASGAGNVDAAFVACAALSICQKVG